MKKKVTIRDVAAAAGVSYQTVSRVLNNKPDVAEKTRRQVRRVIEHLAPRGRFILASVHTIQINVPAENIVAMVDALEELGRHPLSH